MSEGEIIKRVQDYLKRHEGSDFSLAVVEGAVRREDGWWYIPVQPSRRPERAFEYHDLLAVVEDEIDEEQQLKVLLVPTSPG